MPIGNKQFKISTDSPGEQQQTECIMQVFWFSDVSPENNILCVSSRAPKEIVCSNLIGYQSLQLNVEYLRRPDGTLKFHLGFNNGSVNGDSYVSVLLFRCSS